LLNDTTLHCIWRYCHSHTGG